MTTLISTGQATGTLTGPFPDRIGQDRISIGYLGSSGTKIDQKLILAELSELQSIFEQRFARLAETWRNETGLSSIAAQKVAHPAYLRTIGMGSRVIPLILKELQERGGQWFQALEAIVGNNPVHDSERLSIPELKARWLEWGRSRGYLT